MTLARRSGTHPGVDVGQRAMGMDNRLRESGLCSATRLVGRHLQTGYL
jgi:hypothetical protein